MLLTEKNCKKLFADKLQYYKDDFAKFYKEIYSQLQIGNSHIEAEKISLMFFDTNHSFYSAIKKLDNHI